MSPRARWARAQVEPFLTEHPDGLRQPVTLALQRLDEIGAILTPERAAEIAAEARAAVLREATDAPASESSTPKRLAEIAARAEAATPGPWGTYEYGGGNLLEIAADLEDTGCGYRARREIARFEGEPLDNDPTHREWTEEEDWTQVQADAAFIAHAREDVPALLAEVKRLETQRRFLVEQVRRKDAASGEGNRALAEFLAEHDAQTGGADFPLRAGHDNPCAYAAGIGPTCTCSKRDGGEAEAPRDERSRWQAIADALNAVDAIGVDLDGTVTDFGTWSVVWDRSAERWVVDAADERGAQTVERRLPTDLPGWDDGLPDQPAPDAQTGGAS